ncbi:MAG TPA: proline dehydrogenase family protein [bacterium]|nr:proline dehydrogenase family protein [bacterium]
MPQASLLRHALLAAAHSPRLAAAAHRHGGRIGVWRFVAGESLDQCVPVLRRLNGDGLLTNTTVLGEGVTDAGVAESIVNQYMAVLDRIDGERLQTNIAVKLTNLGLEFGEDVAYRNAARLVEHAARYANFVRIDMEESRYVDATLRIYRRLRESGHDRVGVVLQSYLYRSERDLVDLLPLAPNVRIVKGAYLEPAGVAYPRKADVDRAYVRLVESALSAQAYTAVATHDDRIIRRTVEFVTRRAIPPAAFEFQMLLGVRPRLQLDLARQGYRVRVAAPHGPEWYPYLMRRLAERPANVLFVARNLLRQ